MANKTLLNGVNEVLKKVGILEGDTGLLTTLTDSPRQIFIDTAVQSLNEVNDEVYSVLDKPKPDQLAEEKPRRRELGGELKHQAHLGHPPPDPEVLPH